MRTQGYRSRSGEGEGGSGGLTTGVAEDAMRWDRASCDESSTVTNT